MMMMMVTTMMMMKTSPSPLLQQPGNKRTTTLVIYLKVTMNKKNNQTLVTLFTSLRALKLLPRNNSVHILALWVHALFEQLLNAALYNWWSCMSKSSTVSALTHFAQKFNDIIFILMAIRGHPSLTG